MGELRVSIDELIETSTQAQNIADDFDTELKSLSGEVDAFLAEWVGLSATDFDESWVEWRAAADSVLSALRTSAGLLEQSAHEYAGQDAANVDALADVERRV